MKITTKIYFLLILVLSLTSYMQAQSLDIQIAKYQLTIDSLNHEIEKIELEIDSIHNQISALKVRKKRKAIEDIDNGKGIETTATVEKDYGKFKLFEGLGEKEIAKFPINSKITILAKVDNYYRIKYKDKTGYISASYLHLEREIREIFSDKSLPPEVNTETSSHNFGYNTPESEKTKTGRTKEHHPNQSQRAKTVNVKGYYRTTKSGKRVYVRPHKRSRPR